MMFRRRSVRILLWVCAAAVMAFAAIMANVYRHMSLEELRPAHAIVVLGASQWNGAPSPVLQARLDYAERLYREGYAPLIILTGGRGNGETFAESRVGKDYLMRHGVDKRAILIEDESRTTLQNLRQAAALLGSHDLHTILLVSHDFHMMRAKAMARDLEMTASAAPVATQNGLERFRYSIRETLVYILFRVLKI